MGTRPRRMSEADAQAAPQAFEDSRRLPGPNRWFAGPAVELTALTSAAANDTALAAWARRVRGLCAALGWPDPQPLVHGKPQGSTLAFAAPEALLYTATEVNEWAWERCVVEPAAGVAGLLLTQPQTDDPARLQALFSARARHEACMPLARLQAAAAHHRLPVFADDDTVSIGAGSGSRCWPRAALPLPMDVPWPRLHDVPTLLVTGSNGKTTVTRLVAAMATSAGLKAGLCSTEGVWVAGQPLFEGDYAGPAGARAVLRHRAVQLAVLETARGGILRRGLAVRRATAAVVTNVSADHLGEYGVANVEDIAHAKLVVAHALQASGSLVLNGADAVLMAVAAAAPQVQAVRRAGRLALFAQQHEHPALLEHRHQGGLTCAARAGRLVLSGAGVSSDLGELAQMPLTLGGAALFNVENIAAASLLAHAAGLPVAAIAACLVQFGARPLDNPGRLEQWQHRGATILLDYAHNPEGLAHLLRVAQALQQRVAPGAQGLALAAPRRTGRLGLLLGQAGNRDDTAITDLAHTAAAFAPDQVLLKELPAMLRGRALGDVSALLQRGLLAAGLRPHQVQHQADEETAAHRLLAWARPGDVVVLPVHTGAVRERLRLLLAA